MSSDLQRIGGIAALIEAALYVTGFAMFLTVLDPAGYVGHAQKVAFLADNQVSLFIANLLIYVVFGVVLVVLVLALHARLKNEAPATMRTATAFGLIWAGLVIASGMIANIGNSTVIALFSENQDQAVSLWLAMSTLQEALGGGNEIVGGLWVLLSSCAALRAAKLAKVLNYIGVLVGLSGILTAVPTFDVLMDVFGIGQIVWFTWLGIVMVQKDPSAT
jgi:hypothetical protein